MHRNVLLVGVLFLLFGGCAHKQNKQASETIIAKQADRILFIVSNAHFYGDTNINASNHFSDLYDIMRVGNVLKGAEEIPTQAKALELIASQKQLSFKPGTDFSFHESVRNLC